MKVQLGHSAALCAVLALVLAACASDGLGGHGRRAQRMGPGGGMMASFGGGSLKAEPAALFLAGLDTDLDSVVTPQEFAAASDRLWASADADKDGAVSIHELNEWRLRWFGSSDGWPGQFHFDADGNSIITRKEFDIGLKTIFQDFDHDKDGKIERAELLAPSPGRSAPAPTMVRAPGPPRDDPDIRG